MTERRGVKGGLGTIVEGKGCTVTLPETVPVSTEGLKVSVVCGK